MGPATATASTPARRSRRRYRAPQDDRAALVEPAWADLLELLAANRLALEGRAIDGLGASIAGFAIEARKELLAKARAFTASFCDPPPAADAAAPVLLSGHQPELFHPGVWFKNFALDALAKSTGGVGLHLLIDSDLCRSPAVRAPTGEVAAPRSIVVPYDGEAEPLPWESRGVASPATLTTFSERLAKALEGLVAEPLIGSMSADLIEAAATSGNLGRALSAARRRVEGHWGSQTLELPLSAACDTPAFARFAGLLIDRIDDVHTAYNSALAAYRRSHRLRTRAQPLPDLAADGPSREAPLWVWTAEDPTRRALFVRRLADGGWELSDRAGGTWAVGAGPLAERTDWADNLRRRGVRIRSRALATTLYARLVLGDLFLHGIGGAKYDEVTDELSRRLFGFAPPAHATLSATVRLPIDYPRVDPGAAVELRAREREMRFHPELFVDRSHPAAGRLISAKRAAVAAPVAIGGPNRVRHDRIERANHALTALLGDERAALEAERQALAERQRAAAVLGSREYSLALYPEATLREAMTRLTAPALKAAAADALAADAPASGASADAADRSRGTDGD
ncbi:MAG: hypothetical protein AAGB00_08510 [Planctomycetota bacterium]